jgi:Tripartite tricarboxylate transporter TctB family
MSDPNRADDRHAPSEQPGANQSLAGGIVLIVFAFFALWAMRDLDSGTLRSIGPGGLPRAAAILIAILGCIIAVAGWRTDVSRVARTAARPVILILLAIMIFAVTIRPWSFGLATTPGLGLVGAGPLTVLVAGFAQRERNWLDLAILACALTAFCMVLFGDLLGLPIPVIPIPMLDLFPEWRPEHVLRLMGALLTAIALVLFIVRRRAHSVGGAGK